MLPFLSVYLTSLLFIDGSRIHVSRNDFEHITIDCQNHILEEISLLIF